MEPERQFVQLLNQLREAHESLRLEHELKIAELEKENAELRRDPARPPGNEGDVGRKGVQKEEDRAELTLDVQDGSADIAQEESNRALPAGGAAAAAALAGRADAATPEQQDAATSREQANLKPSRSSTARAAHLALKPEDITPSDWLWERFDFVVGFAILLYTLVMFLGLHIDGVRNGKILVHEKPPEFAGLSAFVHGMEHAFNGLFLIEFLIRLFFFRSRYFYDETIQWFNLFDCSLVWMTILEAYVLSSLSVNVSYIRSVRIIRLLRSLRVVRTFRFFTSLRVLVTTVAASFMALFWSLVLLAIVMLIGALSLCQLLSSSITDDGVALGVRTWVNRYYGTPSRSLWTFFEMTFSGCWPNYARTLTEDVSGLYMIFFAFYIAGVVFALIRIIAALFLKETLAIASTDSDVQINAKMKEKQTYATKLQDFFLEADTSGDGYISQAEFLDMLSHPRARAYLAYLEIDSTESINLFNVIDDGDGRISAEEFVKSVLRLKGVARAQDLVILMHEIYKLKKGVVRLHKVSKDVHEKVHNIHSGRDFQDVTVRGVPDCELSTAPVQSPSLYPPLHPAHRRYLAPNDGD